MDTRDKGFTLVGIFITLIIVALLASGSIILFTRKTKTAIESEKKATEKAENARNLLEERQNSIENALQE